MLEDIRVAGRLIMYRCHHDWAHVAGAIHHADVVRIVRAGMNYGASRCIFSPWLRGHGCADRDNASRLQRSAPAESNGADENKAGEGGAGVFPFAHLCAFSGAKRGACYSS